MNVNRPYIDFEQKYHRGEMSVGRDDEVTTLPNRYTLTAIILHWVLALLMFTLIGLGWYMVEIPRGAPPRGVFFNLHKSIGLITAMIILVQLWWRIRHAPPPLPATLPQWEMKAAKIGHALLYACMIVMTLSGYIESNFTKYGIKFFGYPLPPWGREDKAISAIFTGIHLFASYVLVTLIAIHIAAALKHLLLDKDKVFQRMLP